MEAQAAQGGTPETPLCLGLGRERRLQGSGRHTVNRIKFFSIRTAVKLGILHSAFIDFLELKCN